MLNKATLFDLMIIIPCYNESISLKFSPFFSFLNKYPNVGVCFVNDGSTDSTLSILNDFKQQLPVQITVLNCEENKGKAGATQEGMLFCSKNYNYKNIAYIDADLATPLKEIYRIHKKIKGELIFVFGSRIKKLGSVIERNSFRFFTGRVIATFISKMLKLGVYDTQCGAKVFTKDVSIQVFKTPFISKWLFDVEIFFRIINIYGRENSLHKMREIPLYVWIDKGDSKVKMTYFFKLWFDLLKIKRKYKNE